MKAPGLENNNPDMDYQKEAHEFVNSFPLGGVVAVSRDKAA